jgi:hypothetical protein
METTLLTTEEVSRLKDLRTKAADVFMDEDLAVTSGDALWLLDLVTRVANDAKAANDQLNRTIQLFRLTLKAVL